MIGFLDLEEPPRLESPPEIIPRHAEQGGRKSLLADCRKLNWPMRKSAPSRIQEDLDNPLDPVNNIHYLVKRFLYAHGGFRRSQVQSYLNLYSFILNPPSDKLEKVDKLLNLAFENPKLLRFRDRYTVNREFPPL